MPGADGFEVLKAAKAANRHSYVVMITGYATLDSALRAVREGAYDYLAKPFSLGQLDVMLARIKDRISLERENRDLRRRLQGGRGAAGPLPPERGGPGSGMGALMPPPPAAPPPPPAQTYAPPAAVARPRTGIAPAAPAPAAASAVDERVATMEERLARMEELLRMAITR